LLRAVDQGLLVPSEIVRAAIYERIERSYQLRRDEIPRKLETFHNALQDLLGVGAKVMEKLIAKNFYNTLGLDFRERQNWTPVDYVNHAQSHMMASLVFVRFSCLCAPRYRLDPVLILRLSQGYEAIGTSGLKLNEHQTALRTVPAHHGHVPCYDPSTEVVCMILRIDDVVSSKGTREPAGGPPGGGMPPGMGMM